MRSWCMYRFCLSVLGHCTHIIGDVFSIYFPHVMEPGASNLLLIKVDILAKLEVTIVLLTPCLIVATEGRMLHKLPPDNETLCDSQN